LDVSPDDPCRARAGGNGADLYSDSYVRANPRFWMYGNLGWLTWLRDELQDDGARMELKGMNGDELLFFVTLPPVDSTGARRKNDGGD
jgi:hypothetical protein